MALSPGRVFQLDPSFFGPNALANQIDRFVQRREEKEIREEEREERDERQTFAENQAFFQNLLELGDREGAAAFHRRTFGSGAQATKTSDEVLDEMFAEGLGIMAEGGDPGSFVSDLINTRLFDSLDPEADREILANEAARSGLLTEYQAGLNEGLDDEQALTRAQTRAQEIANEEASREAQQRAELDNIVANDPSIPGNSFVVAAALGQLDEQRLGNALTSARTELTGAQSIETRRRANLLLTQRRALRQEMATMAQETPEAQAALKSAQPDIEGIGSLVAGRVSPDKVIAFVLDPNTELVQGQDRALLEEASETYRTQLRSELEASIREADPRLSGAMTILKDAELFAESAPELVSAAAAMVAQDAFGRDAVNVEFNEGFLGFGRGLETSILMEELIGVVNDVEGLPGAGEVEQDVTFLRDSLIRDVAGLEGTEPLDLAEISPEVLTAVREDVEAAIESAPDANSRQVAEAVLASLPQPTEVTDVETGEVVEAADKTQVEGEEGTIFDSMEVLKERASGLPSSDQLQARSLFSKIQSSENRINTLQRQIEFFQTRGSEPGRARDRISDLESRIATAQTELAEAKRQLEGLVGGN